MNYGSCHGINGRGTGNGTAGPSLHQSTYRFVLNILRGVQGSLKEYANLLFEEILECCAGIHGTG
jgi:hypothetical protein